MRCRAAELREARAEIVEHRAALPQFRLSPPFSPFEREVGDERRHICQRAQPADYREWRQSTRPERGVQRGGIPV